MNQEHLLKQLNSTPIKVNEKLIRLKINEAEHLMNRYKGFIKMDMVSKGMKVVEDFMKESFIIKYIIEHLDGKSNGSWMNKGKIVFKELNEGFPKESFILSYLTYREHESLLKRYETLLKHVKNGYIQPSFSINSAGSIYTAKPSLKLPHPDLSFIFDCGYFHFDSLDKVVNSISNAKADSEIVTVIGKTVYYRSKKFWEEKEIQRKEALKTFEESACDFIPFTSYYDEIYLEYLGLSQLIVYK